MEYIAHSDKERVQTLKAHLEGTARLAEAFASRFGKGDWGYCCGLLHDIGKYSDDFQKKIRENSMAMVRNPARKLRRLGLVYMIFSSFALKW